jgi:D-alanine-D-alanine ligase
VRLGHPDLLDAAAGDVAIDAALCIAEGFARNREAWAPVLLEMLGVRNSVRMRSRCRCRSTGLDARGRGGGRRASGAGRRVRSREEAERVAPPGGFPCFVKPRWEGTAKGIDRASRVASRDALVAAVARVVSRYRQPALVEHFLEGAEYTVTVIGNDPPRALPVLQRALEAETRIGIHAVETPAASLRYVVPGILDARTRSSSKASRSAPTRPSNAATSRAPTSSATTAAARSSSRSTRCRPSRRTRRSASSPR